MADITPIIRVAQGCRGQPRQGIFVACIYAICYKSRQLSPIAGSNLEEVENMIKDARKTNKMGSYYWQCCDCGGFCGWANVNPQATITRHALCPFCRTCDKDAELKKVYQDTEQKTTPYGFLNDPHFQ